KFATTARSRTWAALTRSPASAWWSILAKGGFPLTSVWLTTRCGRRPLPQPRHRVCAERTRRGVGAPLQLGSQRGRVREALHLPGWRAFPYERNDRRGRRPGPGDSRRRESPRALRAHAAAVATATRERPRRGRSAGRRADL